MTSPSRPRSRLAYYVKRGAPWALAVVEIKRTLDGIEAELDAHIAAMAPEQRAAYETRLAARRRADGEG